MKEHQIELAAKILKAVSNDKRLQILCAISDKEMSVGEIEQLVKLSQSALSQHLAVLRAADIVKTRRKAQTIFYVLKDKNVKQILDLLRKLFA